MVTLYNIVVVYPDRAGRRRFTAVMVSGAADGGVAEKMYYIIWVE